ncbi:hypothetical protein MIR68_009561 [Amoeboaphelidium protococcarum]|nr:hypothetical protein MIR68_009561 [Amoeboaphelidium protococcarum]
MLRVCKLNLTSALIKRRVGHGRQLSLSAVRRQDAVSTGKDGQVANTEAPQQQQVNFEDEHKKTAYKWLQMMPGKDDGEKSQNAVFATATTALLFGKEIIPYTGDTVYLIPFTIVMYYMFKMASPPIADLVNAVIKEEDKIWADSKSKAESKLESEIHAISGSGITELEDMVKDIFAQAKQVTKLEADAYKHQQEVEFYTKAKSILDNWVRYETAEREKEQRRIAQEVMDRVMAAVNDPKFADRYLEQCIGDIEQALQKQNI